MSKLFFSNPKVSLSFPTTNLSYCYIKYSGNTVATSTVVNSGKITTGSYTSGDLSINTLYTFTLTPLGAGDVSGIIKTISVDTTPQVAGTKSNVKSTYEATRLQWSGTTYDNYTVTRSINNTNSYTDISTNVKTNYYYDNDLSGNTFYYYYVKPYDAAGNQYQNATTLTIYTNVRAPTDMSYTFFDSSAVSVKFVTKNSYSTSYYNAAYAVSPTGAVLSISGDIQSGTITGLSKNTTYTCYAQTYLLANSGTTVTATTASPYVGGNIFLYSVSMNSISVGWSGQYFDRVDVSRRVGTLLPYTTICGEIYTSYLQKDVKYYCSFNTGDVNGNTMYDYATGSYDITCTVTPATTALSTTYYKYGTSSFYPANTTNHFKLPSFTTNGSTLTVMFYAYFTATAATNDVLRCFDFGNGGNNYNIQSRLTYSGSSTIIIGYYLNTGGTSWAKQFTYSYTSYTLGTWVNIAYVLSGTNVYFYVNGTLVNTITTSVFPPTVERTDNRIGYSHWAEKSALSAYMDEFYVFDSALSASQIQSYMTKTSLSTYIYTNNSYVDGDISGNTTYYYYVTPKVSVFTGSASTVVSATTPVAYPTDVSAIFYDTSAIKLQFSTPKNTYTSVVYSALANNTTTGYTTTVTGTSPIMITNLSSGTTYTCYIQVNLNGGTIGTSSGLSVTTNFTYNYTYYTFGTLPNSSSFGTGDACTCCSETGKYMYVSRGALYFSSDYGNTWSTYTPSYTIFGVCCSWDGSIVYINGGGYVHKSTNYGSTFTQIASGLDTSCRATCCSSDGVYVYIAVFNNYVYYSSNSGASFTAASTNTSLIVIKCSPDGKYLVGSPIMGNLYTWYSSNYGVSWSQTTMSNSAGCVAISQNGTYILTLNSSSWYLSTNGGTSFNVLPSPVNGAYALQGCAMSSSGKYMLVAYGSSGGIYYSTDYGSSWTLISGSTSFTLAKGNAPWTNFSMSANGGYALCQNNTSTSYYIIKGLSGTITSAQIVSDYIFFLNFGSSTIPTKDYTGTYTLSYTSGTGIGTVSMVNDATRGYVLYANYAGGSSGGNLLFVPIPSFTIFSYCGWFYYTAGDGNPVFMCSSNTSNTIFFKADGRLTFNNNGISDTQVSAPLGSQWSHIALTLSSSKTVNVYKNGSLTYTGSITNLTTESGWYPMSYVQLGFCCNIYGDNLRFYNRTLSASEVLSIYEYENSNPKN